MTDSTSPTTPAPTTAHTPPPIAPPGSALEIATMLADGRIDTREAGKLARAGNVSMLDIARARGGLLAANPMARPVVQSGPQVALSPRDAETAIGWEKDNLAKGRITREEANTRLDALGATPEQRAPDQRTDEQKQLDQQFPPAKESEYMIRYYTPGQEPAVTPKEVLAFDANARGWMADMGLPRDFGNSTVNILSKSIQHLSTLSPEQRESYKEQENDKLRALFGGQDKLNEALEPARQMIHEVEQKRPGLKDFVRAHGDHAMFVAQLIQAARVYHARKGR